MNNLNKGKLYPREKYLSRIRGFYHEYEIIKVITGVRRCGKSSLMKMIIQELIEQNIPEENIFYFNLDKRPYVSIRKPEQLDELIEKHYRPDTNQYLFIDEVQNVENYENVINSWREEGNLSIFLTGSNSYLLSGELATKLTGRYIEFNVLPLTLDEFVGIKHYFGKEIPTDSQELLNEYIYEGGFPYMVRLDSLADKRTYAENLIEEIYIKDIEKRIKIRNRSAFDAVMKYIIGNFGATTSITNIVNALKQNGINIKAETVHRYIEALINAKIIMPCERFDIKSKKTLKAEKKYYLSDLSFYYSMNTDNRINYGPVLENIVYNYAAGMNYKISVGKIGKLECDFILRNESLSYSYVQVAYTILSSEETENREYRSLESVSGDNYPKYVMTTDKLLQNRNGIHHVNLIDFIISEKEF